MIHPTHRLFPVSRAVLRTGFALALAGLVAAIALGLSAPAGAAQSDDPLQAERWKTRPLVVVAPAADDPLLRGVRAALDTPAERQAFAERDMVLYTVVAGRGQRDGRPLAPMQTRALLAGLGLDAAAPASLVLVGKDGGAKLAQRDTADLRAVFAEIDGMPMRRGEVR